MNNRLVRRALTVAAVCAAQACALPANALSSSRALATFEGHTIDLSLGWGDAHACMVDDMGVTCFRSEQAMDQVQVAINARTQLASVAPAVALSLCSTALRLYDGTSFSGSVLSITSRGALVSLSGLGFDNVTSSYKVGACGAHLYSGIQTGLYPGNTAANAQATSMLSGWDNTISSVLIP